MSPSHLRGSAKLMCTAVQFVAGVLAVLATSVASQDQSLSGSVDLAIDANTGRDLLMATAGDVNGMSRISCYHSRLMSSLGNVDYPCFYTNDLFYVTEDNWVRFASDGSATQSELRMPAFVGNGFDAETETTSLAAILRIPAALTEGSLTFMQVTGETTPFIRLALESSKSKDGTSYQDHIFVYYKDGTDENVISAALVARPNEAFMASISIAGGSATVTVAGQSVNWEVNWPDVDNNFRAGLSVGATSAPVNVDFKAVNWVFHDSYQVAAGQPIDPNGLAPSLPLVLTTGVTSDPSVNNNAPFVDEPDETPAPVPADDAPVPADDTPAPVPADDAPVPVPDEADPIEPDEDPDYDPSTWQYPSDVPGMQRVVCYHSKLQAPTPSTNDRYYPCEYADQWFYLTDEGYARFQIEGDGLRSELRIPAREENGFVVGQSTTSLHSVLKLPTELSNPNDRYTFMQIHGTGTSFIRLSHEALKDQHDQTWEDYLWLFYKNGDSSSSEVISEPLAPRPSGDFEALISLDGGLGRVEIDGAVFEWDLDWHDTENYFKCGVYIQEVEGTVRADFKSVNWKFHDNYINNEPDQPTDPMGLDVSPDLSV